MPGVTDVINVALRRIGANAITSLTDGSNEANVADDVYEGLRDDLLRSNNWNFATKRRKLAQSATAPTFEFDYAYPLPSDWIRTISVHDNDAGYGTILYRMEEVNSQRCIVANSDQIYLRYVYKVTDPNKMSADFRDALSYAIARDLSIPLAASNTMFQLMDQKLNQSLSRARSSDGMGGFPEMRPRGSWAKSRGGRSDEYFSD